MQTETWICCQLGAREHYAMPRALRERDALERLLTDVWVPPNSFLSDVGGLRGRFHSDLGNEHITSWNLGLLRFEAAAKARRLYGWDLIMARNSWFQRKVARWLSRNAEELTEKLTVFAYCYAAKEIFQLAKQRGWKTVLGQIDPGPVEEEIVAQEVARRPERAEGWKPAPAEYWENWRDECELADRISVNSEWSRACLMKAGVDGSKLTVVPLAYESTPTSEQRTRSFPAQFSEDRPMRVLFLGQVNLRKGIARLFDAIRSLEDEPIEFWFVGQVQVSVPADLLKRPGLRWFGAVPRSNTTRFYREADVLIFPTLSDGFGLTQLEAQATKLPVIASRCCGEVVRNGENGFLLSEPTAVEIENALRRVLNNPGILETFSRDARIEEQFSLNALGQNLGRLAEELKATARPA